MSLDQVRDAASSFDAANEVRGAAERCGLEVSVESFAGGVRAVLKDPNRDDAVVGYVESASQFDSATGTSTAP